MTQIIFHDRDGTQREVEAQPGTSVMSVAVAAGIPGIIGECNGQMSCATCHVHLLEGTGFRPRSTDEEDLLELAEDITDQSRLACQLRIKDGMQKVVVEVVGQ